MNKKEKQKPGRPRKDEMRQIKICPHDRVYQFRIYVGNEVDAKIVEFKAGDRISEKQIKELNIFEHHLEPKGAELNEEKTLAIIEQEKMMNLSKRHGEQVNKSETVMQSNITQEKVMVPDGRGGMIEKSQTVSPKEKKKQMPSYLSVSNEIR